MDLKDGGARSRKLWLAAGTSLGIVGVALLAARIPALVPLFDTLVGGLLGVLALYLGGNVAAKQVLKKQSSAPKGARQEDGPPVEGA